jgi:hypothetical protein
MINTQKHTRSSKKIIIAATIVVACCLAGVGAMALTHTGPFSKKTSTSTSQSQDNSTPAPVTSDSTAGDNETPGKTPASNEPTESTTPSDQVTASITAANQNGNVLQIRTLIEAVSSDGTCKLTLSKDEVSHTYNAGTQAQASASTCKGFDVPVSDLSAGTWKISIDINIKSKTAHLTKDITIS